jgi:hypothetical protein
LDHCHITKTFRGYLCRNCNVMLGGANDNTLILLEGVAYIDQHFAATAEAGP